VDYTELQTIARRQHGLITKSQTAQLGWDRQRWSRALASGRLERIHPTVARLPGAEKSRLQTILSGVLAVGSGCVASHRSGAEVWGALVLGGSPVDVTVDRHRSYVNLDGVVIHRPRVRTDLAPSLWHGIPVTNPLRTLVDLGAVDPERVGETMRAFLISGLLTSSVVTDVVERHSRQGRHGVQALRSALAEWEFDEAPADSELEVAMMGLLRAHSLPEAKFHARVCGFEVDFLLVGTPIVIECDGWEFHGREPSQFERDRERDAMLVGAGYAVMRFTWNQVTRRSNWVADRIGEVVARLGGLG
jgi:very-short-patch-repair endonuclease